MNQDLIYKLQAHNFKVNRKGTISKYSQRARRYEVAGQINEAGVYFHAQNVPPFKQGQNTFKDLFGSDTSYTYTPAPIKQIEKKVEHSFSFDDYIKTTKKRSQFSTYLKAFYKETLGKELNTNLYDIRGIKGGYFEDATLFPYINYNNEFITAKVVKYNTITGKRLKENYSNTWFHADKTIKAELGIKDKISKSINCFFGEHLLIDNDKPVVIVEAEKTAILLSYIYKETIFIATGGLAKLKSLNWSFLANRQVFVFPDNNAKEWFEIAEKRSWWISNILENYGSSGEDVADYLTDTECETRAFIWNLIHQELADINTRKISNNGIDAKELNFEHKRDISLKYCLPIPVDAGIIYYHDKAKGKKFKGNHFFIYDNEFKVLNANIDFNKAFKNEFGQWQQIDASTFLRKLKKCFKIIKHLNNDKDYISLFSKVLYNLILNSNHTFNIGYIERVIIPIWDKENTNIEFYYKTRNWRFFSKESVERKEFQKRLNEDKKLADTNRYLLKLQPLLNKNKYILPEYIGLHSKQINPYAWELIKRYNKAVFGSSTYKNYTSKLKVSEYLNHWNETSTSNERTRKFCSTYYNSNIGCKENEYKAEIPPIRYIKENTGVGQTIITQYLTFKPDNEELNLIINEVEYFITNKQDFIFKRVNNRLVIAPDLETRTNKEKSVILSDSTLTCGEAFNYEYDYTGNVLDVPLYKAENKGGGFLSSWILFHYPDLDDYERSLAHSSPVYYLNERLRRVS